MCPHIQEAQNESHTTIVARRQKAATKVLVLRKQKLFLRNIVTKESTFEEWKQRQKAKELLEGVPGKLPPTEKCIKDPVEIHNIKQRNEESTEELVRRYKLECMDVKGAPKCMKISRFMHRITNPELIKQLHDKIPKSIDEIMGITATFLRGEMAASNRERKKSFTLLTKTPREIIALDKGKFKPPPPMTTLVERRNASKFYEFHREVDHTTDECMHLKRKIEKMLKAGKLSHLIKELKQNNRKDQEKTAKKGETSGKDKRMAILMANIVASKDRQRGTLNVHSNEFHGGEITISLQQDYRKTEGRKDSGNSIHSTWNDKILKEGRKELCELLRRHLDVFAWKPADMTRVPRHIAEHRLNIRKGCLPVRQNKRGQMPKRNKAISEEVKKLVEAGIIKEVHYHSWLSNPVMVKKHDDSWRMCVDFKDLNKACPKDGYSLPKIDWKVESLCGYPYKCFLDAYKGYHQIKMTEDDEEKTTLITSQGIFCYLKMSFGLKNARAPYQRLVDKAFQKQIGQNLEVYVDDLVIKSQTEKESAEKSLSFFKTLKKCTKKNNFQWTPEAEEEFKEVKQSIAKLTMLTAPKEKKELIIHLAAAIEAISAVLMTERDRKQIPIYFVSRALQGPEINYTPMENLILALPRTSIKGQILADFIVECPEDGTPDLPMKDREELTYPWILFIDGSSCVDGSGADLIIMNPEAMEFTYTLRFRFNATYNEAEYEALIVGLWIASQMGLKTSGQPGSCSMHAGPRSVVAKALRSGYFWPTMHTDARNLIIECKDCQVHRPVPKNRQEKLTSITSPWPFYKWGINIAGPFSKGPSKVKFLILTIDYFTKWIEAKPVASITGTQVKKFV
nr:reverse transcriptase domain-containing protein [Tanacetum cinerariifolium]